MGSKKLLLGMLLGACGSAGGAATTDGGEAADASGGDASSPSFDAGPVSAPKFTELWYSVDDRLVHIGISAADGTIVGFTESQLTGQQIGQNSLTMLDDGSLVGARLSDEDNKTRFYHIVDPPRDGSPAVAIGLGEMPDDLMIEALYTDCDGRLYAMDTGVDDTNAVGNRLLRFTGEVVSGDLNYVVVSDLSSADVADIDDMGPGIVDNEIVDNPGFAIDTGNIYHFAYDTGSGTQIGQGGSYGIHALGAQLFEDDRSRLYLFSVDGDLFEVDLDGFTVSESLGRGPTDVEGLAGWSGLTGPLTDCESGFVID